MKELVKSGVIGKITGADAEMAIPKMFGDDDIRFQYDLGGGATMDLGCEYMRPSPREASKLNELGYAISCVRYVLDAEPTGIVKIAVNKHHHERIDRSLRAIFDMPNDVTSSIYCDFSMPKRSILGPLPFFRWLPRLPSFRINVIGEEGEICLENFLVPSIYHYITITKRKETKTIKAYTGENLTNPAKGEAWWST